MQETSNRNGYEAFHDSNENIETEKWRAFVKNPLAKGLSTIFSGGVIAGVSVAICIFFKS